MIANQTTQFELITPANQPDYRNMVAPLATASWPEFMLHDPISDKHWSALFERFPEYQFGLLDTETNQAVAMGNSVPLHWEKNLADLPEEGWDWAFEQAVQNHEAGAAPNIQCAIQVAIHPTYQGRGLSTHMVQTMRSIGRSMGFGSLIAPVRPSQKADYPLSEIDHYINWKSANDLPFDAWLRVHVRVGGRIIKACHRSMIISGTSAEWQSWTGLGFRKAALIMSPRR